MQLWNDVTAYWYIEGISKRRHLAPRRDAANTGQIEYHDIPGTRHKKVPKCRNSVVMLTASRRHIEPIPKFGETREIQMADWIQKPTRTCFLQSPASFDRLRMAPAVSCVDHDIDAGTSGIPRSADPIRLISCRCQLD